MKNSILLSAFLILLFNINVHSQSGWYSLSTGTLRNLSSIFFTDANTGYAVGDSGTVIKTTNGGINWTQQVSGVTVEINTVYFLNNQSGYASLYSSQVLKTTSGGAGWNVLNTGTSGGFFEIFFNDINTGYGINSNVYKTTNGGINWISLPIPACIYRSLWFTDYNTGYVIGSYTGNCVFKTTNAGITWIDLMSTYSGLRVRFLNALTGFIVGGGGAIIKTTNGGSTWTNYVFNTSHNYTSTFIVNSNIVYVAGFNGVIDKSTNGGINWFAQNSGTSNVLTSIFFTSPDTGYAAGRSGLILKTVTGGVTNLKPISSEVPKDFKLYQNYPNPFNASTKFKIQISKLSDVKLILYDILGREITTLVNEALKPWTYEVEWDASNYPSGVYYCKLAAEDYSQTKKMVLLK